MLEDTYGQVSIRNTREVFLLFKRACNITQLDATLRQKAGQVSESTKHVNFSLFLRVYEALKRSGGQNMEPLWKFVYKAGIVLPEPYTPPRDIIVQQRTEALRQKFANLEYQKMTKNLTPLGNRSRYRVSEYDQVRCVRKQILMVVNFVLVVAGTFVFGYFVFDIFGESQATPAQRTICGFILAMVVFFADLYFLLRNVEAVEDSQRLVEDHRPS